MTPIATMSLGSVCEDRKVFRALAGEGADRKAKAPWRWVNGPTTGTAEGPWERWTKPPEVGNLVVEVFDARHEIYRFHDERSDIRRHDHAGEGDLPVGLVDELSSVPADLVDENR